MKLFVLFLTGCWATTLAAQTAAAPAQNQSNKGETIHQLFMEDQEEIPGASNGISKLTPQQYEEGLKAREAKVRDMVANGELKTGNDFEEASFIFQHGNDPSDCLLAHVLAMEAVVKGDDSARWIEAATLDRYLQSIKQPQVFGTQYPLDPNLPHAVANPNAARFLTGRTLEPYNKQLLPNSVRNDFCVPDVRQQEENVAMFNAGKRPSGTMKLPACHR